MVFFSQFFGDLFGGQSLFWTAPLRITIWISWVPGIMLSKTLMESWAVNFQRIRRGGDAMRWLCRCMMMCVTIGYAVYGIHCITPKFAMLMRNTEHIWKMMIRTQFWGHLTLFPDKPGVCIAAWFAGVCLDLRSNRPDMTCFFPSVFFFNAKPQKESSKPLSVSLNPVVSCSLFLGV